MPLPVPDEHWYRWTESLDGQGHRYSVPTTFTWTASENPHYYGTSGTNATLYFFPRDWYSTGSATTNMTARWTNVLVRPEYDAAVAEIEAVADDVARRDRLATEALQRQARAASRTAAIARADALLASMLSGPQLDAWRLYGHFEVIGSAGTVYRLHRGVSGNVEWLRPDGHPGGRLCAHPEMRQGWLPVEDVLVSQLLALMTDEVGFVRTANVHAGARPPVAVG